MIRIALWLLLSIQFVLTLRFFRRVRATLDATLIPHSVESAREGSVCVIVPVYNEVDRIDDCLSALTVQNGVVRVILVVDGGSTDGTQQSVERFSRCDPRIQLVSAPPIPDTWNGKAWGLEIGLRASDPAVDWVVTVDADVRCGPSAIARVVSFAECEEIPFLSVACRQIARTAGLSLVHPSLLTSLVYRFGIPGHIAHTLEEVQSNGQFAIYARDPLLQAGGFAVARASTCEDVTLARHLFLSGYNVGFYDGEHLAETEMHSGMVDCLRNWPRSLNLRDRFRPMAGIEGLANMVFLQVIPLILVATSLRSPGVTHPVLLLNRILLGARIGVLVGTRRAYRNPNWTYWMSPLADPLSLAIYAANLVKRNHSWRGRRLVTEDV